MNDDDDNTETTPTTPQLSGQQWISVYRGVHICRSTRPELEKELARRMEQQEKRELLS